METLKRSSLENVSRQLTKEPQAVYFPEDKEKGNSYWESQLRTKFGSRMEYKWAELNYGHRILLR